jgi:hypothetical protein
MTTETCTHLNTLANATPSSQGCEDCLRIGGQWVHLRLCMECGHVGCCDNSPTRTVAPLTRVHSPDNTAPVRGPHPLPDPRPVGYP